MKLNLAIVGKWFQKHEGFLQLLTSAIGISGILYGLHIVMVERAVIPICSAELLTAKGEDNFLYNQKLTIEVAGAVVEPGVWQFEVGSRVAAAINKAGGFSQRADRAFSVQGLNLARVLEDGEKIYIPFDGEADFEEKIETNQLTTVSINSASIKELQALPGIGEVRATQIIENRPYSSVSELLSKEVLTEAIFKDLEALITL